jgi:hypothetical protein
LRQGISKRGQCSSSGKTERSFLKKVAAGVHGDEFWVMSWDFLPLTGCVDFLSTSVVYLRLKKERPLKLINSQQINSLIYDNDLAPLTSLNFSCLRFTKRRLADNSQRTTHNPKPTTCPKDANSSKAQQQPVA